MKEVVCECNNVSAVKNSFYFVNTISFFIHVCYEKNVDEKSYFVSQ